MGESILKEWIDAVNRFNQSMGLPMLRYPHSKDANVEESESPVVTEGMASMPWSEFETLTRKAAMCDAHEPMSDENQRLKDEIAGLRSELSLYETEHYNQQIGGY